MCCSVVMYGEVLSFNEFYGRIIVSRKIELMKKIMMCVIIVFIVCWIVC